VAQQRVALGFITAGPQRGSASQPVEPLAGSASCRFDPHGEFAG
jgi:hypothetical protein